MKVESFESGGFIIHAVVSIVRCMHAKIFNLATVVTRSFCDFPQSLHVNASILSLHMP